MLGVIVLVLVFTPQLSVGPMTLKERWQLLLSGQMVKLSGWSHGPSRALLHDQVHVLSPDHNSSPLMTHHVVSPYLSYLFLSISHTFDTRGNGVFTC